MTRLAAALASLITTAACGSAATPTAAAPTTPASPAPAAPAVELIPRAALFGNPTRANPKLSPDGKWLSWIAPKEGVLNVWVAPVVELAAVRPITDEKSRPITQYFWAETSDTILYINDRGGDEDFLLYAADVKTGAVRPLTPFEKTRVRLFATSQKKPREIIVGLNNRNPQFHDAYRLDVPTGKLTLVLKNDGWLQLYFDDTLTLKAATKPNPGGGMEAYRLSAKGKPEAKPFVSISGDDALSTGLIGFTTARS